MSQNATDDDYGSGTVLPWLIIGSTCMVFTISVWRSYKVLFSNTGISTYRLQITRLVHIVLPFTLLAILVERVWTKSDDFRDQQKAIHTIILGGIPGFMFSFMYWALLVFWSLLYYRGHNELTFRMENLINGGIGFTLMCVWFVFWVSVLVNKNNNHLFLLVYKVEVDIATAILALGTLGHFLIGFKIWLKSRATIFDHPFILMYQGVALLTLFSVIIVTAKCIVLILFVNVLSPELSIVGGAVLDIGDCILSLLAMWLLSPWFKNTEEIIEFNENSLNSEKKINEQTRLV